MTKQDIIRKIASRKFWSMIVGLFIALSDVLGLPDTTEANIIKLISAIGVVAIYMLAEGLADSGRKTETASK